MSTRLICRNDTEGAPPPRVFDKVLYGRVTQRFASSDSILMLDEDGILHMSTDGYTFTHHEIPPDIVFVAPTFFGIGHAHVAFLSGVYYSVEIGGVRTSSDNGVTWSSRTPLTGVDLSTALAFEVVAGPTGLTLLQLNETTALLYNSTDGIAWTLQTSIAAGAGNAWQPPQGNMLARDSSTVISVHLSRIATSTGTPTAIMYTATTTTFTARLTNAGASAAGVVRIGASTYCVMYVPQSTGVSVYRTTPDLTTWTTRTAPSLSNCIYATNGVVGFTVAQYIPNSGSLRSAISLNGTTITAVDDVIYPVHYSGLLYAYDSLFNLSGTGRFAFRQAASPTGGIAFAATSGEVAILYRPFLFDSEDSGARIVRYTPAQTTITRPLYNSGALNGTPQAALSSSGTLRGFIAFGDFYESNPPLYTTLVQRANTSASATANRLFLLGGRYFWVVQTDSAAQFFEVSTDYNTLYTAPTRPVGAGRFYSVAYDSGSGTYVAVGGTTTSTLYRWVYTRAGTGGVWTQRLFTTGAAAARVVIWDGTRFLMGTSDGIYASTDFGVTWELFGLSGQAVSQLVLAGGILVATTASSLIYASNNGGASWVESSVGSPALDLVGYVGGFAYVRNAGSSTTAVGFSFDGTSWTETVLSGAPITDYAIATSPNGEVVAVQTLDVGSGVYVNPPPATRIF
jgi:hypothetical protein